MSADSAALRARLIAEARRWIGTPVLSIAPRCAAWGPDCLGLVRGRRGVGVIGPEPEHLPAYAPDWAEAGRRETLTDAAARHLHNVPLDQIQPGDVLLFRFRAHLPAKHAAILCAPDRMLHAYDGIAVCDTALTPWWHRRLAAAFAFPGTL